MAQPRWLDEEEHHTWRSYLAATRLLAAQLDRELQHDSGIPQSYYEILVRLSETPGRRLRMSDLADASDSSRSRLSHAVARLVANGWVERESCPTDRRGAFAVLTDAGFEALSNAAPSHVASVRAHLFDRLTPEQVVQLGQINDAILAGLREASAEIDQECTAREQERTAPPQVA
ncbi:MarR family transcriptional regulator [Kineosporia rhizophila]|uniref:MarR family winged helix-turn-helix transcriptional regulator n=1 Tax=Kineosporia TaxID=49184 RepID=UPI001E300553|nr:MULTISPECIES: MarR family transcriptional regulator [Kineosporia]MCE0539406.1 MarR family transcriptional regulator [Kineosporia rhizophila]